MHTEIKWQGECLFAAKADSGHTITIDGPPESGGQNQGVRPMELMLMGVVGALRLMLSTSCPSRVRM